MATCRIIGRCRGAQVFGGDPRKGRQKVEADVEKIGLHLAGGACRLGYVIIFESAIGSSPERLLLTRKQVTVAGFASFATTPFETTAPPTLVVQRRDEAK